MTVSSDSSNKSKLRLAIMILAAGEGSRLGGYPKALLRKNGESLLKRFVNSMQSLKPIETLVVSGFYSDKIEGEINSLNQGILSSIALIKNANPQLGQSSSVRLGLEMLKSEYDVLLIALCDQPNIANAEIEALLEQFNQRDLNQEIILPMVNGQRGNPVLFSRGVIERILAIPRMVCRPFMDQHPELVKAFDTNNEAYLMDVDTQADIQKLGLDPI
jgi:molybdenum cofactor cytidylyltransferase/nicotine blue oxidoreductase